MSRVGQELLQRHLERGTQSLVLQDRHTRLYVVLGVEAIDSALQKEVANALTSVGELRQLVGDALEQPFEVVAGVRSERFA